MLGWVGTLINKSWLDRERYVHPSERRPRCEHGRVRKEGIKEGAGSVYRLPSDWWDPAGETGDG